MAAVVNPMIRPRSMEQALADLRASYSLRPTAGLKLMIAHLEAEITARRQAKQSAREP